MINIGVKNLAGLNMPGACERCFWIKMNFKVPWDIFPGIFSVIANHSAECMAALNGFSVIEKGEFIAPPSWRKFQAVTYQEVEIDGNTLSAEVNVRGQADYIQRVPEGIEIFDFKTAKYTPGQEFLLPLYKAQLNLYAWIYERKGGDDVSKLGLVYCEPNGGEVSLEAGDFAMQFTPKLVEIKRDQTMASRLANRAASIVLQDKCPEQTSDCADCAKLDTIIREVAR